jgi:single-strand DNA-binding protein
MLNKAFLIGRLGKDPEVKYTPDGAMVTSFSLATMEQWKDRNGEKTQKTEWHNIVTFGKLAEICGNYLVKGSLVYIEGRIRTRSWEGKDGVKRYTTEIAATDMKMLTPKGTTKNEGGGGLSSPFNDSGPSPEDDVPFWGILVMKWKKAVFRFAYLAEMLAGKLRLYTVTLADITEGRAFIAGTRTKGESSWSLSVFSAERK